MKLRITVASVIVLVILLYVFTLLGGFEKVEVTLVNENKYYILGIPFNGKYNDPTLEDIYFEVKESKDKGVVQGEITVINYQLGGDSTEQGWVRQFIGIKSDDKTKDNGSLVILTQPTGEIIRAKVSSHNLVMPKPDEIDKLVMQMANELNVNVVNYTIERYVSDRELYIDTPIIN